MRGILPIVLLLLAGCSTPGPESLAGQSDSPATGPQDPPALPEPDSADPSVPLEVSDFSGVSAGLGVGACDNLLIPLAQLPEPVPIPSRASSVRLEVVYQPTGPVGLNELSVSVHRDEPAVGGANFITSQRGPSPIVVDLTEGDWEDAATLDIIVYVCDAPAEQPFEGRASFFQRDIPDGYSASS